MADRFFNRQGPIDRYHRTFLANGLAAGAAPGTFRGGVLPAGEHAHLQRLNLSNELSPQLMGALLDDRVMRHPYDVPLSPIQRDGNFRRLMEKLIKFFLESGRCTIHGCDP